MKGINIKYLFESLMHSGAINISQEEHDALVFIRNFRDKQTSMYLEDNIKDNYLEERSRVGLAIYNLNWELHQYIYMSEQHLPYFKINKKGIKITPCKVKQSRLKEIK